MARWIKVGVDTPYKTAIKNIAHDCNCSRGDAFLAWFELYSWLDEQTADGRLYADREDLDRKAGLPGCAVSLERSGWLAFDGDECTITNWDEHNGQNAKRRALNAKRMSATRDELRKQGIPVQPCPKMPVRSNVFTLCAQNEHEIR